MSIYRYLQISTDIYQYLSVSVQVSEWMEYEWISQRSFKPLEMPSDQNWRCFQQEGIQALHCLRGTGSTVTRTSKWKYHTRKITKNHRTLEKIWKKWKNHRKTVCENHIDLWSLSICVNLCQSVSCSERLLDKNRRPRQDGAVELIWLLGRHDDLTTLRLERHEKKPMSIRSISHVYLPRSWSSLLLWVYLMYIWCISDVYLLYAVCVCCRHLESNDAWSDSFSLALEPTSEDFQGPSQPSQPSQPQARKSCMRRPRVPSPSKYI